MFAALNSFLTRTVSGYFLNKSLRFRSSASAYIDRTFPVAGSQTTWTWSGWVKRGTLGQTYRNLFGITNGSNDSGYLGICFGANGIADNLGFQGWNTVYRATTAVYRDPAAWYHIVLAVDTTQATAANRILMYVNGDQVTSFSTSNNPAQNATLIINSAVAHQISRDIANGGYYDGELAEVNFVNGQALAPTAFGAFSTYNQWLPKKYAGTYGTNGFYLPFNSVSTSSYAGSFNGSSQYLTVPDSTAFTLGTNDFTIECWVYFTSSSTYPIFIGQGSSGLTYATSAFYIQLYATNDLTCQFNSTTGVITLNITSAANAVPNNSWNHIAITRNGNTLRMYINGVQAGTTSAVGFTCNDSSALLGVGCAGSHVGTPMTGYISNFRLVNGTCLYPSGTTFTPPTAPLTAVTNTALLTLQNATIVDNSTNAFTITNTGTVVTSVQYPFTLAIAADSSGNANNWTPNNISLTAGSTYDSLTDVPTLTSATVANYAVYTPLATVVTGGGTALATLTNGNLTASSAAANFYDCFCSFNIPTTGKWYFEWSVTTVGTNHYLGIASRLSWTAASRFYQNNGDKISNGTSSAYGATYTSGDVVGCAIDMDAGTLVMYKNNTTQGTLASDLVSAAPATGWCVVAEMRGTAAHSINFGQQPFTYTAPSGFLPLNTFNI